MGSKEFKRLLVAGSISLSLLSSCLSLKPLNKNPGPGTSAISDLKEVDGDYEIFSVDTCFRTLAFAFTFSDKFKFKDSTRADDRINLKAIDNKRLQATVYKDGEIIKSKIIKGRISDGYFTFRSSHFKTISPVYVLLNGYASQKNSIRLTTGSDLVLDSYIMGLLLVTVVPTFASSGEVHNKIFRRKTDTK